MKKLISILLTCLAYQAIHAQFDFCLGTKGDPIFIEDFGSGLSYGPALAADVTSYEFITGLPEDGQYTLFHSTGLGNNFHNRPDRTPNDSNGKALIVNADFNPGEFYRREVSGLCINTTFEFTAWVLNVYNPATNACANNGIPVNVKFQIWNAEETELLAEMNTGNISGTIGANWTQYGLTFTTVNDTNVVLKMLNNAPGGCGNDLAIDDIMFRSCGAEVDLKDQYANGFLNVCQDEFPIDLQLQLELENPENFLYQWQFSSDGVNFEDLVGQNSTTYQATINQAGNFRVKIAQDVLNMNNPYCYTTTEVYTISASDRPLAPTFIADVAACQGTTPAPLQVSAAENVQINWYNSPTAGTPLATNTLSYYTETPGLYYAEAVDAQGHCTSDTRTPVRLTFYQAPEFTESQTELFFCNQTALILDAGITADRYEWSSNLGSTRAVTVSQPGTYTVTAYNEFNCSSQRTFIVNNYHAPILTAVVEQDNQLTIQLQNPGDYAYSLDGTLWQSSPIFTNLPGGVYTIYVKENHGCGQIQQPYIVLLPMKFFTPNGDGINDLFSFTAFEYHNTGFVRIFDRYGRFLKELTPEQPFWDGTFHNQPLPSSDYWYYADLGNGRIHRGHFTLKR